MPVDSRPNMRGPSEASSALERNRGAKLHIDLDLATAKAYMLSRQYDDAFHVMRRIKRQGRDCDDPETTAQIDFWAAILLILIDKPGPARKNLERAQVEFRKALMAGKTCPEVHMLRQWLQRAEMDEKREEYDIEEEDPAYIVLQRSVKLRAGGDETMGGKSNTDGLGIWERTMREDFLSLGIS
jgi:hypothetical protein